MYYPKVAEEHEESLLIGWQCAYPGSFVRGGPTLTTFLVDEGREDKRVAIGPPAKHYLIGVSLSGRWWPNIEYLLGGFVIFQGIRTSIVKKSYIFVIFQ